MLVIPDDDDNPLSEWDWNVLLGLWQLRTPPRLLDIQPDVPIFRVLTEELT